MRIEFLYFADCPNHQAAHDLLMSVLKAKHVRDPVEATNLSDQAHAQRLRFPGSPTIRINGADIEPGFVDPGDYSPRCRLYLTHPRPSGIPQREWIEQAIDQVR